MMRDLYRQYLARRIGRRDEAAAFFHFHPDLVWC